MLERLTEINQLQESDYSVQYQPELTAELDRSILPFNSSVIDRITLWKVNRYVHVDQTLLGHLGAVYEWEALKRDEAKQILVSLLNTRGVRLAMASTYLRFINPRVFQIIDQRAFRALYGRKLTLPNKIVNNQQREGLATTYFKYLDDLRSLCNNLEIQFEQADRILYNFDKRANGKLTM